MEKRGQTNVSRRFSEAARDTTRTLAEVFQIHTLEQGTGGFPKDDYQCRQEIQVGMNNYFQVNNLSYTAQSLTEEERTHEFLKNSSNLAGPLSLREIVRTYHNDSKLTLPRDNQSCRRVVEAGMEAYFNSPARTQPFGTVDMKPSEIK